MDVVYNHTNEADDEHPYTTSFRGIDNKVTNLFSYFSLKLNDPMLSHSSSLLKVLSLRVKEFSLLFHFCTLRYFCNNSLNLPLVH